MIESIWKYEVDTSGRTELIVPDDAQFLWLDKQVSPDMTSLQLVVWARVDPTAPGKPRRIRIVGTGELFETETIGTYIGTTQVQLATIEGGVKSVVFHAYDEELFA